MDLSWASVSVDEFQLNFQRNVGFSPQAVKRITCYVVDSTQHVSAEGQNSDIFYDKPVKCFYIA